MRILYIDIDSLRADHLGCYGYRRGVSPNIDALARRSAVFGNCHTSDAPCMPSRAALFSGRFGINNGVTCHDGPASILRYPGHGHSHDASCPMWMRAMQELGYETVCFSGFGKRHLAWWFFAGFTQHFGNQLPGALENADEVAGKAIDWIRRDGHTDNWFMHVNFWDVHHPYRAPESYWRAVEERPLDGGPSDDELAWDAEHVYGPRTARDWWSGLGWQNPGTGPWQRMPRTGPIDRESYKGFTDGADAGLLFVDEQIGLILEELEKQGVLDETAVIISSDHGEAVGELGMYYEHGNACEGVTHVPLIVHWPGHTEGGSRHDGLCYQLDLPPTLVELLGGEVPSRWDGRSLAPAVRGEAHPGRDHLVIGAGIYSFQRAVRDERYRLIRTLHSGVFPYDPLYLFDLQEDPMQRRNLAEAMPEKVAELDHKMLEFVLERTTGPAGQPDPFMTQIHAGFDPDLYCRYPEMEQRLIDIGRDDQLADLRKRREPRPAPNPWTAPR